MPVLKIAVRLISEHRVLFAIYVLLFSAVGVPLPPGASVL